MCLVCMGVFEGVKGEFEGVYGCVRVCMGVSKRACGCDKGVYGGV